MRALRSLIPGHGPLCEICPHRLRGAIAHRIIVVLGVFQVVVMLLALATFAHGAVEASENPVLLAYRIGILEAEVGTIKGEHRTLLVLLVGNLVAVCASLVTYMLKIPRPKPWDGTERRIAR